MNGHDISVGYPRESEVIKDAKKLFEGEIEIEHTNLEGFWADAEKYLDREKMTVLKGERRSYLKEGKWTYLFPGTISARTYLKQADFDAYTALCYVAEPLNALAGNDSTNYLKRGWKYLISNHSHDANGGCAPDTVCKDMEYRFRKAKDIADIIAELSSGMTLLPGTIIATGTPSGVGMGFDPPRFLKSGDIVECAIEKIGTLRNPVR
jgi:mannosylglycerate hydrolase